MERDESEPARARRAGANAAAASPARSREELCRRVAEGYYLTPRVTWEVAKCIAKSGEA